MKSYKTIPVILSVLFSFIPTILSAQMTWTCATPAAQWVERGGQSLIVFHDTMWILGGMGPLSTLNDV